MEKLICQFCEKNIEKEKARKFCSPQCSHDFHILKSMLLKKERVKKQNQVQG